MKSLRPKRTLAAFAADASGNIALLAGLLIVLVVGAGGVGLDFQRVGAARDRAQLALDGAAIAGVRAIMDGQDLAAARARALATYRANYRPDAVATFNFDGERFTGDVSDSIPTTLSQVFGVTSMGMNLHSAATAGSGGIELVMVLDVSGSMGGEIPSLRQAATSLLDQIYGLDDTRPKTWVALAPFSGRVNVIGYGSGWMTGLPRMSDGPTAAVGTTCKVNAQDTDYPRLCPARRASPYDQDDTLPAIAPFDEYMDSWEVCPVPKAIGLTASRAAVQARVDQLCAGHGTSTYEGMAWGWRMISPRWRGRWGDPDLPLNLADSPGKYVVIMTDGQNHPNQSNDPLTTAQADDKLLETCTKMKAEGIVIFAVTFNMSGALATLYRQCTSKVEYQFDAESGAELDEVFTTIGKLVSSGEVRLIE